MPIPEKNFEKISKKVLTFGLGYDIIIHVAERYSKAISKSDEATKACGSIAQLGEHLPYKQRVIGSSPIVPTKSGPVVQLVRTLACHARGRRFEPVPGRHKCLCSSVGRAGD